MAIDDVSSDYETSVANNGYLSVQPASGDEWLVTHIIMTGVVGTWDILSHTSTAIAVIGYFGGNATTDFEFGPVGLNEQAWLVTNSEYIRIKNRTSGTRSMGYSAIKTKD
jgi:hypothetical protein